MKTRSLFRRQLLCMSLLLPMLCIIMVFYSCKGQDKNTRVLQAYELRMNGHADSALAILDQVVAQDSANGLAWFEIARTYDHMALGGSGNMLEMHEKIHDAIRKAVEADPENAYFLVQRGAYEALDVYVALKMGTGDVSDALKKVEQTYNAVAEMDADYIGGKLTLVEYFGGLPPEMGGDKDKAEKYAEELAQADLILGAKAREILMPEDADYIAFWEGIIEQDPENPEPYRSLASIYLYSDSINEARKYLDKVMELDPGDKNPYLTLGRYYMMQVMQGRAPLDSIAPLIEGEFNKYLESDPEPSGPMKAWIYGHLAKVKFHSGDKEAGEKLLQDANALDPYFSKAFGEPGKDLYAPPDEVVMNPNYFFRPF